MKHIKKFLIMLFFISYFSVKSFSQNEVSVELYADLIIESIVTIGNQPEKQGLITLDYYNKSAKDSIAFYLSMWSFVDFNKDNPETSSCPDKTELINYVYFLDSTDWKNHCSPIFGCGNYFAIEAYQSIKIIAPQQHFRVYLTFLYQDALFEAIKKQEKYMQVLNSMAIIGKDVNREWLKERELLYPFDDFTLKIVEIEKYSYDGEASIIIKKKSHNFIEMPRTLSSSLKSYEMPLIKLKVSE